MHEELKRTLRHFAAQGERSRPIFFAGRATILDDLTFKIMAWEPDRTAGNTFLVFWAGRRTVSFGWRSRSGFAAVLTLAERGQLALPWNKFQAAETNAGLGGQSRAGRLLMCILAHSVTSNRSAHPRRLA